MLGIFIVVPPPEPPSTSTTAAHTAKGPPQIKIDEERGLTTTITALEVVPTLTAPVNIVYMSVVSIKAMA